MARSADQPLTRRERRAIARADRAAAPRARRRSRYEQPPVWRQPMALFTGAALLIGLALIAFAVASQPAAPTEEVIGPAVTVPEGLADGRTLGSADAPVTIEIWSDFQCPACQLFAEETEPGIVADFVVSGTARLVYRDAAFQGQRGDPNYDESVEAAAAARSAAEQGRFWEMHNWIIANWNGENEGAFRAERLREMAAAAGLDLARYDTSMASGKHQAAVRAETAQGVAAGINSTPTIVINGTPFSGALTYEQMAQLIAAAVE